MRLSDKLKRNPEPKFAVFDKAFDVQFKLGFIPKDELNKITSQFTSMKRNRKNHVMEEELDTEGLRKRICELSVKDWKNVNYRWLSTQVALEDVEDLDEAITFSQENLEDLIGMVYGLDAWIFETVRDGARFNQEAQDAEIKN